MSSYITVAAKAGNIKGISQGACNVFRGIPYAKAPVGQLRFCPPQPLESFADTYEALTFPNRFIQREWDEGDFYCKEFQYAAPDRTPASEDALCLNIWAPAEPKEGGYPVAFWIHGGAFMHGFGHEVTMDGTAWAKQGVIFVSINYRLGALGFLAHPWLAAESKQGVSGNYGILDQIAALNWIYENIGAFGGDRDRITIMGQSAGCMSVQTLVSSELTGNKIHQAILQSGGGYGSPLMRKYPMEDALANGIAFVEFLGVQSLEELRALPAEEILEKQFAFMQYQWEHGGNTGLMFAPAIDGYVLKADCDTLVEQEAVKNIPYMIGATKDDLDLTKEQRAAGAETVLLQAAREFGGMRAQQNGKPVYAYHFAHDLKGDDAGAFHSSELWYEFGTYDRCWRPMEADDVQLSETIVREWTGFVKNGMPDNPEWKPCTAELPYVRVYK